VGGAADSLASQIARSAYDDEVPTAEHAGLLYGIWCSTTGVTKYDFDERLRKAVAETVRLGTVTVVGTPVQTIVPPTAVRWPGVQQLEGALSLTCLRRVAC
jgi:hypothetical protein